MGDQRSDPTFRSRVFLELKAQRTNSAAGHPAVEPDDVRRYPPLTTGG